MNDAADSSTGNPESNPTPEAGTGAASSPRRTIKIGSQRETDSSQQPAAKPDAQQQLESPTPQPEPSSSVAPPSTAAPATSPSKTTVAAEDPSNMPTPEVDSSGQMTYPPPRIQRLPEELQHEIDEALEGISLDDLMAGDGTTQERGPEPKLDERYRASVVKVHRDNIFFALPGLYEGMASMRQFDEPPELGETMDVIVRKFNAEEGFYELSVPGKSISVADWSDIEEGAIIEATVTGHNSGGLECEINKIRAFMPISQVALYRVEDLEQFLGERWACVVTEANPQRANLVISRRAALEREREAAKEKLLGELHPGKELEGVVRSIRDFGAFVDLGGVDGLVHISKLSWDRVNHPSDVLEEGQRIKVKIEKIDEATGKIGLSYRDTLEQPWTNAERNFPVGAIVDGTVSKIMDFGAFVRLAAGIEGLVHVSELAHHRVSRVDSIVQPGKSVQVKVLSVDPQNQRMSLSIKAVQQPPETETKTRKTDEVMDEPLRTKATKTQDGPLKGGTNRKTGGEQFGLNW